MCCPLHMYGCMVGDQVTILLVFQLRCGKVCPHVAAIHFMLETCTWLEVAKQNCTDACVWNQTFQKGASLLCFAIGLIMNDYKFTFIFES